jgi:predicted hotdog family 3-hydroxylacyl-ACP dehydratase
MMTADQVLAQPITKLLPQAPPMALLDRAVRIEGDDFEAELTIRADSPFCDGEKVGSWVGIEYMAQAIAASAGAGALMKDEKVKAGFLLGTREYLPKNAYFKVGSTLRIRVKKVVANADGLAMVDCSLTDAATAETLVNASLMVFETADLPAFLKKQDS